MIVTQGLARGGEYKQSIAGRLKHLLMSENNAREERHMVGREKPMLCPYVTVSQSASRLSTYARMSPMNNLPSGSLLLLWSENATIDQ